MLTEQGRNAESDLLVGEIFRKAGPDNGAADWLHFQYAINALDNGDTGRASKHLAMADSLAVRLRGEDDAYFRSYSNLLHAILDFKQTGRVKLMHINGLNNRQSERFNRLEASRWESERGALRQQNRALALKAESEHKTVVILIIGIVALLVVAGAFWVVITRGSVSVRMRNVSKPCRRWSTSINLYRRQLKSRKSKTRRHCAA